MTATTNPYQSPPELIADVGGFDGPIQLDGVVTAEDVVKLIGTPRIVIVMRVVGFVVLAPFIVLALWLVLFQDRMRAESFGMLGMLTVLSAILLVADRLVSARARAMRMLKRHPGLAGPIRGYLDSFGLTFHSEYADQMHQFSWATFPKTEVSASGIRLDWKAADGSFIAISASCIDGYSSAAIEERVTGYRNQATESAVHQVLPSWDAAPVGSLKFRNLVLAKTPATKWQGRMAWIWSGLSYVAIAATLLVFLFDFPGSLVAVLIGIAVVTQVMAYRIFTEIAPARYAFGLWGWVTQQGGQAHLPGITSQFNWSDAKEISSIEEQVIAYFHDGTAFYIAQNDLLPNSETNSPEHDWQTLRGWIAAVSANE